MRRFALVAINPGRTRKLRIGKRRGGAAIVRISKATKKVLSRAAGGRKIPDYWIGLRFDQIPGLERELARVGRERTACDRWAPSCDDLPGKRCPRQTFRRKADFLEALDQAVGGKLRSGRAGGSPYLDVLDPGAPQLGDLSQYADRKGRRKFHTWRQAFDWLAPRSRRFADVDDMRLAEVSEKIREALGPGELDDVGGFTALVPPLATEIAKRKPRRAKECADRQQEAAEDLIAGVRAALERLVDADDTPF